MTEPSQDDINSSQAQTNLVQATTNAEFRTNIEWLTKLQWWQMGLLVTQLAVSAGIASKLLGGPGPHEAVAAIGALI